jgi:lincosamide nucleotidyltransferase B/F
MEARSLLIRLDEIGYSLEHSGHALALVAVGSVGLELDRLDDYSDLDFFAIVEDGYKSAYITSLEWLSNVHPIAYYFPNTEDGFKLLFTDGVFCEFAVFELDDLKKVPFAPGRVIWKRTEIPDTVSQLVVTSTPLSRRDLDWLIGEALTNLFVGMKREKRGEKLSAMRFIQNYAVDRLLELVEHIDEEKPADRDPFVNERRIEQRYPNLQSKLPTWAQGYERNRESALAILHFLDENFSINAVMAEAIRKLCE